MMKKHSGLFVSLESPLYPKIDDWHVFLLSLINSSDVSVFNESSFLLKGDMLTLRRAVKEVQNREATFLRLAEESFELAKGLRTRFSSSAVVSSLYRDFLTQAHVFFQYGLSFLELTPEEDHSLLSRVVRRRSSTTMHRPGEMLAQLNGAMASSTRGRAGSLSREKDKAKGSLEGWKALFTFFDDAIKLQEQDLKPCRVGCPNDNQAIMEGSWFWPEAYSLRAEAAVKWLHSQDGMIVDQRVSQEIDFLLATAIKKETLGLKFNGLLFLIQMLKEAKSKNFEHPLYELVSLFEIKKAKEPEALLEDLKSFFISMGYQYSEGLYGLFLENFQLEQQKELCRHIVGVLASHSDLSEEVQNRQALRCVSLLQAKYLPASSLFKLYSLTALGFPEDLLLGGLCLSLDKKATKAEFDGFAENFLKRLSEIPVECRQQAEAQRQGEQEAEAMRLLQVKAMREEAESVASGLVNSIIDEAALMLGFFGNRLARGLTREQRNTVGSAEEAGLSVGVTFAVKL